MQVTNELKRMLAEVKRCQAAVANGNAVSKQAMEAAQAADIALRAAYLKVQEEARRGYPNNQFPSRRLVLVDGKGYLLDLTGSVQGEVVREMEVEQ